MQALLCFTVVFLLIAALYFLIPPFFGPPSVPTRHERIRKALRLAKLQPGEMLYDFGAGDGRVLVIAAREFNANAVGVEIGPVQCAVSLGNAVWNRVSSKVRIEARNFYHADVGNADVVFAYLTSDHAVRLQEKLRRELKSGARVVTVSFNFPDWQHTHLDRENLIFLYEK
ncbi:MAG: 50S ribosomal protein L11 methyltransferase [Chloroflexi bacterium]|nr:50S ribosomal protein L11 methyltransferase [Chloroflexota bacterium]